MNPGKVFVDHIDSILVVNPLAIEEVQEKILSLL
jgi:hypothetical protein